MAVSNSYTVKYNFSASLYLPAYSNFLPYVKYN